MANNELLQQATRPPMSPQDIGTMQAAAQKGNIFSQLGQVLTNTAIGINSPEELLRNQQRQREAEQQYEQFRQQQALRQQQLELERANMAMRQQDMQLEQQMYPLKVAEMQSKIEKRQKDAEMQQMMYQMMGQDVGGQGVGSAGASPINSLVRNLPEGVSVKVGPFSVAGKRLTDTEVKRLTNAEALATEINELEGILKSDQKKPFTQKAQFKGAMPFGLGTESGQNFDMRRRSIAERLLRLRSGAQINEKEYDRFMTLLPKLFRRDSVDLKQLETFRNEFDSVQKRILEKRGVQTKDQPSTNLKNLFEGLE